MEYHDPVLLQPSIAGLKIIPDGIYVDVTFGGGGHSKEILNQLNEKGRLYAFDQDEDAIKNTILDDRFTLIQGNFRYIKRFLRVFGVTKVNGILADLGVSSHQFDIPERGFSTRFDALLDMRMDSKSEISAFDIVNTYEEAKLKNILSQYGELNNAKALANAIVKARQEAVIKTSFQLKETINKFLPPIKQHKVLAQIFQAIRIEVNQELEALKAFLLQTTDLLATDGKLSVISYHSLEDRLVKNYFKYGNFEGEPEKDFYGNISTPFKKPEKLLVPSYDEIKKNNRARSAKLRIVTKI